MRAFVATWRAASRLGGRGGAFVATWRAASRLGGCGGAFVATWCAASRLRMTQRVFGDAQCDALERDAARHVATKTVGSTVDGRNAGLAWYAHGDGGRDGRGNLRVAKTPPLQSTWAGIPLRRIATDHHLRPRGHQRERRMGGSRRGTPRRYVLRETGESGLNHRIPKGTAAKGPEGVKRLWSRLF